MTFPQIGKSQVRREQGGNALSLASILGNLHYNVLYKNYHSFFTHLQLLNAHYENQETLQFR